MIYPLPDVFCSNLFLHTLNIWFHLSLSFRPQLSKVSGKRAPFCSYSLSLALKLIFPGQSPGEGVLLSMDTTRFLIDISRKFKKDDSNGLFKKVTLFYFNNFINFHSGEFLGKSRWLHAALSIRVPQVFNRNTEQR